MTTLRFLKMAGLALLVVVGLVVVYRFGGSRLPQGEDPSLSTRLEGELNTGATSVDFATLAPGTWDTLHIFSPYTTKSKAEAALGKPWERFDSTGIADNDAFYLVVFARDGDVVNWYQQPLFVDLEALAAASPFERSSASFEVSRSADGWVLTPRR